MKYDGKSKKKGKNIDQWKYRLIKKIVLESTKQQWILLNEKGFGRIEYAQDKRQSWLWDWKALMTANFKDLKEVYDTLSIEVL